MKKLIIILLFSLYSQAIEIKQMPIEFSQKRIELTKQYIKNSYGLEVKNINIIPKIIVIHHTAVDDLKESFNRLNPEILLTDRKDITNAGNLNVSTQFLVDLDGTIYSLMPETYMARHVIGLNFSSIGVENVGGNKKSLTTEQLKDIYLGKITNWKEIGGADKKIVVLSRDSSSGTHVYFKEHILRNGDSKGTEEFGSTVLFLPSNEAIKQQVNNVDGAIGYIGLGYLDDTIKILSIDNVIPTVENVKNKSYSISRAVYWYVDEEMSETTKQLVEYMLSDKGQKIVLDEGFVSIK